MAVRRSTIPSNGQACQQYVHVIEEMDGSLLKDALARGRDDAHEGTG
jgi:hypothetical protein